SSILPSRRPTRTIEPSMRAETRVSSPARGFGTAVAGVSLAACSMMASFLVAPAGGLAPAVSSDLHSFTGRGIRQTQGRPCRSAFARHLKFEFRVLDRIRGHTVGMMDVSRRDGAAEMMAVFRRTRVTGKLAVKIDRLVVIKQRLRILERELHH